MLGSRVAGRNSITRENDAGRSVRAAYHVPVAEYETSQSSRPSSADPVELRSGGNTATLIRPAGTSVCGVVIAHGGSDDGRRFFLDEAMSFASRGAVVVLPVMRFPGHGDRSATEASIQRTVRAYQWALDVLEAEGSPRLGFYGHSGGAFLGILLAVADDRLEALVLAGFGSGTLTRVAAMNSVSPEYLEYLDQYDPRHQLPRRHRMRVLIQHGRQDEQVPIAEGRAMHAAASGDVDDVVWAEYDGRHTIDDPAAYRDRLAFFGLH
jgi:pimeloyl-ACP methyl ester carboxylesterase